jgi:hypothetical protein
LTPTRYVLVLFVSFCGCVSGCVARCVLVVCDCVDCRGMSVCMWCGCVCMCVCVCVCVSVRVC